MTKAAIGLGLLLSISPARAALVVDVSPSFRPGPYATLSVDPQNSSHVFVGTSDGHVLWTSDAGESSKEATVLSPREYVSAPLRSQGPLRTWVGQKKSDRSQLSGLNGEPPGTRYFLYALKEGNFVAKWQYWMSIANPQTDITDVFPFTDEHPGFVASSAGLFSAGAEDGAWTRVLGAPRPKEPDVSVFAVTVDPGDPSHVLAGTSVGLMVSLNGGRTFRHHDDEKLADEEFHRFTWDRANSKHLLASTENSIFQSTDGGVTLEEAFSTKNTINAVTLSSDGVYIATSQGMLVPHGAGRKKKLFPNQSVVGVVPLGEGWIITATDDTVYLRSDEGEQQQLLHAGPGDPVLRVQGDDSTAWVLTKYSLFRISTTEVKRGPASPYPPRMLLSAIGLEDAIRERTGAGNPRATRLGSVGLVTSRWWIFLIPKIKLTFHSVQSQEGDFTYDNTFIPSRVSRVLSSADYCRPQLGEPHSTVLNIYSPCNPKPQFTAMFMWDISNMFAKASTPWAMIEMNLRTMHEQILSEVRWRYREAATLVAQLVRPPADTRTRLLWRLRLEELGAYLEGVSGRRVIDMGRDDEGESE